MERQLALPRHRESAGSFRLWRMTVAIACFGITAVTSAQAAPPQTDRVRSADTALVAWNSTPLPIASSGPTHQAHLDAVAAVEPKQSPRAAMVDAGADGLWQGVAPTNSRLDSALLLDADSLPLGAQGRSPMNVLLANLGGPVAATDSGDLQNSPTIASARAASAGSVESSAGAGLAKSSSYAAGPSGMAIVWAVAAIAACGLGVAGLRGPFLATRFTPVKRGLKP